MTPADIEEAGPQITQITQIRTLESDVEYLSNRLKSGHLTNQRHFLRS